MNIKATINKLQKALMQREKGQGNERFYLEENIFMRTRKMNTLTEHGCMGICVMKTISIQLMIM